MIQVNQTIRKYTVVLSGIKWRTTANGGVITTLQEIEDAIPGMFYELDLIEDHPQLSRTGTLLVFKQGDDKRYLAISGEFVWLRENDEVFRVIQSNNRPISLTVDNWNSIPFTKNGEYTLIDTSLATNRPELFTAPTPGISIQYNCILLGTSDRQTLLMFKSQNRYLWDLASNTIQELTNGTGGGGETGETETYTNTEPSVEKVGGIEAGSTFVNKTMSQMWDMALYPEKTPSLTNPSYSISLNPSAQYQEVGASINYAITDNFNRGTISPAYGTSGFRSGASTGYSGSESGENIIEIGNNTFSRTVDFSQGEQPKTNKGNNYDAPYPAGSLTAAKTVVGVYPVYATTVSINALTKQTLQAHGSQLIVEMLADSGTDKQTIQVPTVWGTLSLVQQYNTLSGQYDTIDKTSFTETSTTVNGISYKQYTYNGSSIGARRLKFIF